MKVKNPVGYNRAQRKVACAQERNQEANRRRVAQLIFEESYFGPDLADIAWQLRRSGALGCKDRTKHPLDSHQRLVLNALDRCIDEGSVAVEKLVPRGIRVSYRSAVDPKQIKKFGQVEYPPTLMMLDDIEDVRDPRVYKHLRGSAVRMLTDAA